MSYRRVLDNLTQGEQRNADRAGRFDQNMITHERNRDLKQLDAIKGFSSSLDQFVQDKYKRDDAQLQKDMELKVAEEHLESKEQTRNPNISDEDYLDYVQNWVTILTNEKDLAKAANSELEQGSTFQEAKQIHNLSGAALYYYVRAKSKIAADGYEDWITGEMKNNEIEIFGPMPSSMQKKANLFNLNLIIQAKSKAKLNYVIKDCIPSIKDIPYSNKIKWTIDIDPIDYDWVNLWKTSLKI